MNASTATVSLKSSTGVWIMISTILASSLAFIDSTALNVVLPSLQQSLHASGSELFWVLNAYLLMLASLILIGGSLGDQFGRKKIFMVGIFIFILGSACCGCSPGVTSLIIFRILQGVGGALMIPGSLSLISSLINKEERGKAIGTWSAFTTVVTMGGPILGGFLGDSGLWRYIFFINVPIGIIALIMLALKVPESRDASNNNKSTDFGGAIAVALGLAFITFGFLRVPASGWGSVQVYGSLVVGALLLLAFLVIEKKSKVPMMPLKLFSSKTFSGANALTFFLYAGLGSGMLFLSLNMVQVQHYTQLQSGLTFLPFTIMMITLARFAGGLADRLGPRLLLIAGPAAAGIGLMMLSFVKQTNGAADYWSSFFPGIIVFGLGMSFTVAPLTATVMGSVADHFSGAASGINNAMTRIANVIAYAIFGALAVLFFSGSLDDRLKDVQLSPKQKQEVMLQADNLGNARVPAGIDAAGKAKIERAYSESFIDAYGKIMKMSSVLAFVGALMSFLFVKNVGVKKS